MLHAPDFEEECVQTCHLEQCALYDNGNMHDKLWSCTVDIQAATMISNNPRPKLVVYVQAYCMPLCSI